MIETQLLDAFIPPQQLRGSCTCLLVRVGVLAVSAAAQGFLTVQASAGFLLEAGRGTAARRCQESPQDRCEQDEKDL